MTTITQKLLTNTITNNMNKIIIAALVALIIGSGGGYIAAKSTVDTQKSDKELADAVSMMNEQSASIRQMSDMMKSGGMLMQEVGMKYKDDTLVAQGKDMAAIGEKNQTANDSRSNQTGMRDVMGN